MEANCQLAKQSRYDSRRTIPWGASEFMRVDGLQLVYTTDKANGLLCRLPGRKSATVEALRASGHVVELPKHLRLCD